MPAKKIVEVLLVEDDPGDVDLTREALLGEGMARAAFKVHLSVVEDGVLAMQYLKREGPYKDAVRPDLILLDLNLPKKDGREVLNEIKHDDALKMIPVVILTTSDADTDILKTYGLGGNCYVTKPVGFDQFMRALKGVGDFWFNTVKLPPRKD